MMPYNLANAASTYCEGKDCNCNDGSCSPSNLAEITWAHAVNSQKELTAALADVNIKMIEADVVMGTIKDSKPETPSLAEETDQQQPEHVKPDNSKPDESSKPKAVPIMAHPPAQMSDLSFEDFVKKVAKHNEGENKKGIKLDFKFMDAVTAALPLMKDVNVKEVWINADIVAGPGVPTSKPLEAKKFFDEINASGYLKKATLSVGWTTGNDAENKIYTKTQVDEMLNAIKANVATTHNITFPVRAIIAVESKDVLTDLVKEMEKAKYSVTFTLWNGKDKEGKQESPDIKKLQDFVNLFGVKKVYVDLPEELKKQLKLKESTGSASGASNLIHYGLLNMAALVFALFFRNGLF